MTGPPLEVDGLTVKYGRNTAVSGMSLRLGHGEIVAVLGANGAGKSSLLKAIQGTVSPTSGEVRLKGRNVTRSTIVERVKGGLVLVPEGRRLFMTLSVHENLLLGAYNRSGDLTAETAAIYERFPNLSARKNHMASVLSGGEQQMLAIGRALLAKPSVIMLDEPSLGLSPKLVSELFELIIDIRRAGISVLLVEQNTQMALAVANYAHVLELGRPVLSGRATVVASDGRLSDAYLGAST